ncbi:MAG: 50S ribosomal protein L18 [Deltaproteobacteria bacterium]|jgi:large subunit ribosomal protein L18|nr:50S ribosomal protein L18 [Deltaproteobacteria bacterium]
MAKDNPRLTARDRRQARVRKKVIGHAARPRLCVFRSSAHIYAQLIDDDKGVTLAAASTLTPALKDALQGKKKTEQAELVGRALAAAVQDKGFKKVVFDRNGFLYHGRVLALSKGARDAGLEF